MTKLPLARRGARKPVKFSEVTFTFQWLRQLRERARYLLASVGLFRPLATCDRAKSLRE